MNLLVMCLIIWRWRTCLSQIMVMKSTEISKSSILKVIKTQSITACWVECQQTTGCETIGTNLEDERTIGVASDCYLFGSHKKTTDANEETPLKVTEISPFTVCYFEFVYSVIHIFGFPYLIFSDYYFVSF